MKIAVVGKGGVGKTTIVAGLARFIGREGYNVIAIDADPSLNLAVSVGIPHDIAEKAPILFNEEEFIRSRTILSNNIYIMNPKVDDVVEKFGIKGPDNVTVIKFGEVRKAGSRCLCPEYAFLRALLSHLILGRKDVVILDMVAGLEPLSRGTIKNIDLMLCVVEPSIKAIDVALKMEKFANEIGIKKIEIVANKIKKEEDIINIEKNLQKKLFHYIPYDESVIEADTYGISLIDFKPSSPAVRALEQLKKKILMYLGKNLYRDAT
ncbi:MAG: AAA family ATPase [Ignisphaera sp.]|uniref:AAA+ ATPase domain-containing protein n=1 Tax=Ignisphaera aggregans TaxID=334771 RepID=A0A7J3MXS6_9CREN